MVNGVKEAALFGNGLHVVAEDGEAAVASVGAALARAGYRVETIGKIAPSLEDVFVSLIEARDRRVQPQGEVAG